MTARLVAQLDSAIAGDVTHTDAAGVVIASPLVWACVLLAVGLWLALPRGGAGGRRFGLLLTLAAVGLLASRLPLLVGWLDVGLFALLATVTVLSCAAAVISRNPVYSAIWFGLALLGTAGLFLLAGAQFLSVATITVYAGAILVTFLFVIMLAQPRGNAHYDRVSWEAFLSAAAGAIMVGLLTGVVERGVGANDRAAAVPTVVPVVERADAAAHGILAENHVAHVGQELLGRHLISMLAAGALMLAALVGAVAIVAHGRKAPAASVELATRSPFRSTSTGRLVSPAKHEVPSNREAPGGIHA